MHAQCVKGAAPLVFGLRVCGPFFFLLSLSGRVFAAPFFLLFGRARGVSLRALRPLGGYSVAPLLLLSLWVGNRLFF